MSLEGSSEFQLCLLPLYVRCAKHYGGPVLKLSCTVHFFIKNELDFDIYQTPNKHVV